MAKPSYEPEGERRVATIKLTAAMRSQIAKQLELDGSANVPSSFRVARVPHDAVGLTAREAINAANSWVLVLV